MDKRKECALKKDKFKERLQRFWQKCPFLFSFIVTAICMGGWSLFARYVVFNWGTTIAAVFAIIISGGTFMAAIDQDNENIRNRLREKQEKEMIDLFKKGGQE